MVEKGMWWVVMECNMCNMCNIAIQKNNVGNICNIGMLNCNIVIA